MSRQLLIHNGNKTIKPWFANRYQSQEFPNITDSWMFSNEVNDLNDKILYLDNYKSVVTDLTPADVICVTDLVELKKNFVFSKVISNFETDSKNLDESRTVYNYNHWMESLFYRLSVADNLIWWNNIAFPSSETNNSLIFTPGRSGTHLLLNILDASSQLASKVEQNNFLHHNGQLIHQTNFQKLINSKHIYSSLRRSLLKQTLSSAICNQTGITMLTTKENLEQNKKIVSAWGKLTFVESDCHNTLVSIMNYADILLGLRYFYQKNISFSIFEELSHHMDSVTYIKNPWRYEELFENYDYALSYCQSYQPFYESIINKISNILGTSLHINE